MYLPELFKKNNLHIQRLGYSCGPCSILNILHLKGEYSQTEEELTELCKSIPSKGTEPEDVLSVCKKVGLEVIETKEEGTLDDIERFINQKAFVIVNYYHAFNGDGHYSVITDFDERAIYIMDCSLGFIRILKEDFPQWWHNTDKTRWGWYAAVK